MTFVSLKKSEISLVSSETLLIVTLKWNLVNFHSKRVRIHSFRAYFTLCQSYFIHSLTLVIRIYFDKHIIRRGGGCPKCLQRTPLYPRMWYQWIGIDLLFPLIPKSVPSDNVWRNYDVIIAEIRKIRILYGKYRKNQNFVKNRRKIRFSCGFLLNNKENN